MNTLDTNQAKSKRSSGLYYSQAILGKVLVSPVLAKAGVKEGRLSLFIPEEEKKQVPLTFTSPGKIVIKATDDTFPGPDGKRELWQTFSVIIILSCKTRHDCDPHRDCPNSESILKSDNWFRIKVDA